MPPGHHLLTQSRKSFKGRPPPRKRQHLCVGLVQSSIGSTFGRGRGVSGEGRGAGGCFGFGGAGLGAFGWGVGSAGGAFDGAFGGAGGTTGGATGGTAGGAAGGATGGAAGVATGFLVGCGTAVASTGGATGFLVGIGTAVTSTGFRGFVGFGLRGGTATPAGGGEGEAKFITTSAAALICGFASFVIVTWKSVSVALPLMYTIAKRVTDTVSSLIDYNLL